MMTTRAAPLTGLREHERKARETRHDLDTPACAPSEDDPGMGFQARV